MKQLVIAITLAALCISNSPVLAASKAEIDARSKEAISNFYKHTSAGKELAKKSAGMLVFPKVLKAGFGIGGEFGEGKLIVNGKTVDYYNIAAASIGFQLGAQVKSEIILFMTKKALNDFRNSKGWEVGADGSVALANIGAGGEIDSNTLTKPIIGFIFSNKGLMYNLSLEGSKITKFDPNKPEVDTSDSGVTGE